MLRFRPWINILAGLWAVITGSWLYVLQPVNLVIVGMVIAAFGFWTYEQEWQGMVNGVIGLWLILSAFFPALIVPVNLWVSGLVVIGFAVWRLTSISSHYPHLPEHPAMG